MKKILYFTTILVFFLLLSFCRSQEVKEEEPDDILEEELRAEAEPIREIRDRDLREEVRKPVKKR